MREICGDSMINIRNVLKASLLAVLVIVSVVMLIEIAIIYPWIFIGILYFAVFFSLILAFYVMLDG